MGVCRSCDPRFDRIFDVAVVDAEGDGEGARNEPCESRVGGRCDAVDEAALGAGDAVRTTAGELSRERLLEVRDKEADLGAAICSASIYIPSAATVDAAAVARPEALTRGFRD